MSGTTVRGRPDERYAMLIGVVSGALYGAIYLLQRAMSPIHAGAAILWMAALYLAATIGIFVCYAAIVWMAASGGLRDDRARLLAFVFPFLFNVALTLGRPYLSTDAFTYVAQGHQVVAGRTPYVEPITALAATPVGRDLTNEGWRAIHDVSPYGPLWTQVEAVAGFVTSDIATNLLLIKMVVTAFSLGSAVLIWLILGVVSPRQQMVGTILYLWNPVVVTELAGEGHNDAVMIFFVVASMYLLVRGKVGESVASAGIGVLVKIVGVVFLPLHVMYLWRTHQLDRRNLEAIFLGACAAVAIGIVAYAPVWAGWHTFDGIRTHIRPNQMSASTPGVLYSYLARSHSERSTVRLLFLLSAGGFLTCVAAASSNIRGAASFVRSLGRVAVAYLVLAPGYWPWYAALPVAVLALAPDHSSLWSIGAISLAARLSAPIDVLRLNGLMDWDGEVFITTLVGVWLPASVVAVRAARGSWIGWRSRPPLVPQAWSGAPGTSVAEQ
jgi:alpha-1,6-mannosyltransferase